MDNMHLVTGYLGREHITAVDQGAFNAALIGTGQFVLDKGNVFKAQVISNNQIRILDGELMMQGRFVRLEPDTYVDLTIANGAQGYYRNDLIVARYTKDISTGVESVNLVVIKGNAVSNNPADPSHTTGDITNGYATMHDFPLWRIPLTEITVGAPVALFGEPFIDSMRTLPDIRQQVNKIHNEVDKQLAEQDKQIDAKIAGIESYTKAETLDNNIKTAFGVGSSAVPKDVFAVIKATLDDRARIATGNYVGTGTNGVTLTFPFKPRLVIVISQSGAWWGNSVAYGCDRMLWVEGMTREIGEPGNYGNYDREFRQEGNSLFWSINHASGDNWKAPELNNTGEVYCYIAIN